MPEIISSEKYHVRSADGRIDIPAISINSSGQMEFGGAGLPVGLNGNFVAAQDVFSITNNTNVSKMTFTKTANLRDALTVRIGPSDETSASSGAIRVGPGILSGISNISAAWLTGANSWVYTKNWFGPIAGGYAFFAGNEDDGNSQGVLYGGNFYAESRNAGNAPNRIAVGMGAQASHSGTGTIAGVYGTEGDGVLEAGCGLVGRVSGLYGRFKNHSATSPTHSSGLFIEAPENDGGGGLGEYYGAELQGGGVKIDNDQFYVGKNQVGNSVISLIGVNTADQVSIAPGAQVSVFGGRVFLPNGSGAAPSLVGTNFPTTGFVWAAGPALQVSVGGAIAWQFTGGGLTAVGSPYFVSGAPNSAYPDAFLGTNQYVIYLDEANNRLVALAKYSTNVAKTHFMPLT